jgi:hypothetical protein
MFLDPHVVFAMFSLCYAQLPNYLLCIVFPSPSILQHYTKFDIRTIVMFEKLLGARSFGGFIGRLAHHQTIFLISSGKLGLLFIVWTATPAFLGCWALIVLAFVTCFQ